MRAWKLREQGWHKRKGQETMPELRWARFYQATKDHPHWASLERAVSLLSQPGHALDLGCGAGRDTRYLLAQGWMVTAVDREVGAVALLAELPRERLQVVQSSFEDFDYGREVYDLVSAQYALPFNPKASFNSVFARVKQSLKPAGIYTGQFFGLRDQWNTPETDMTFLTREQVDELLSDMRVIELKEEEHLGNTATGESKYWHTFQVIAQKKTA
jgi:tellurite methyltransferase